MTDKPVRVRIAPSPSGYLHVGTARTAIFNWLFARHYDGQFLIRIEDTDVARSKPEMIEPILNALKWLGVDSDEPILYQSKRLDIYGGFAEKILAAGHGYRCFCTQEQLAADREEAKAKKGPLQYNRRCLKLTDDEIQRRLDDGIPYTIRIRIPEGSTSFDDMVSGEVTRQNAEIEDFIIARSDGSATYNLAVVVDDHEMGISHVIRGNDHITNTFKQIHIYRALDFDLPAFGHVPLILRPDKKKVSKRLGDKDVGEYRQEGIAAAAMFNYLCLLGWSPKAKDDREIFTVDELIDIFTEKNFNASNAVFDPEKLEAINREHLVRRSDHELAAELVPLLIDAGIQSKYWFETRWEYLRTVVGLLKDRARRVADLVDLSSYFFTDEFEYDETARTKNFTPDAAERLEKLADRFEQMKTFTAQTTEQALGELADELEVKKAKLIHPTRLAVSGRPAGPSLYHMLEVLSRQAVVPRMRRAVEYIRTQL